MKPTAPVGAKGKDVVRNLLGFFRLQAKIDAGIPTFSKFLGMSVEPTEIDDQKAIVREDRFSFENRSSGEPKQQQQSMVFRYRLPPNERLRQLDQGGTDNEHKIIRARRNGPSLSTYTSILDEVTTLHLVSSAKKHPRPGVSVTMQSQWGPGAAAHHARSSSSDKDLPEEVDIVTTITKRGRTLGFVRAEVRDPSNNDSLICHFDHVKYLPTGWVLGLMLTPVGRWCLNLLMTYVVPLFRKTQESTKEDFTGIMDSFSQTSDTTATFRFGPQHSNGMGGLHGGVQAVLMERLGKSVAQNELQNSGLLGGGMEHSVECERLSVSYQSSASRVLELRAHVLDPPRPDRPSVTLRIEVVRSSDKSGNSGTSKRGVVVVSEGILTFSTNASSSKPKDQ